jgi:prevent-host-death family protein
MGRADAVDVCAPLVAITSPFPTSCPPRLPMPPVSKDAIAQADGILLVEARNRLGLLVGRVRHGHEHILISEYGKPAAALIPIAGLEELQRLRDETDVAEIRARRETPAELPGGATLTRLRVGPGASTRAAEGPAGFGGALSHVQLGVSP